MDTLVSLGGDMVTLAKGVVKFYRGEKNKWTEFAVGVLVWCTDQETGLQYLKLIGLTDGEVLLSEELYENFSETYACTRTTRGTHHFHTMEFEDYVAGACFAKEMEALEFSKKMPIMAPKPAKKLDPKEAKRLAAEEKEREKLLAKEAKAKEKQEKKEAKEAKKAAKKAGKGGEQPKEMEIGMPTNFKHVTHIGWDDQAGFQTQNLPPEWKRLFKDAGIKKKELEDISTAKIIVQTLAEQMTDEQLAQLPHLPGITDRRGSAMASGGAKLRKVVEQVAPKPADDDPRNGLLSAIQKGIQLKKVEVDKTSKPAPAPPKGNDLAATLANAIGRRRQAQESDDESDDDSDWEDDD